MDPEDPCRAPCNYPAPRVGGEGQTGPGLSSAGPIVMETKPYLTSESSWQNIQEYYKKNGQNLVIKDLFAQDSARFDKYRLVFIHSFYVLFNRCDFCDLYSTLSYSKDL